MHRLFQRWNLPRPTQIYNTLLYAHRQFPPLLYPTPCAAFSKGGTVSGDTQFIMFSHTHIVTPRRCSIHSYAPPFPKAEFAAPHAIYNVLPHTHRHSPPLHYPQLCTAFSKAGTVSGDTQFIMFSHTRIVTPAVALSTAMHRLFQRRNLPRPTQICNTLPYTHRQFPPLLYPTPCAAFSKGGTVSGDTPLDFCGIYGILITDSSTISI